MVELCAGDQDAAVALWAEADLVRPWNDPAGDFVRAREGATSTVLGVWDAGRLAGTVMVGHDGHRGWLYYLAVASGRRHEGIGTRLAAAGAEWLRARGAVKVQLMVRSENLDLAPFYERLGFEVSDVRVYARWLDDAP